MVAKKVLKCTKGKRGFKIGQGLKCKGLFWFDVCKCVVFLFIRCLKIDSVISYIWHPWKRSPGGGIGRRVRFRGVCQQWRGGSTPPSGTYFFCRRFVFVHAFLFGFYPNQLRDLSIWSVIRFVQSFDSLMLHSHWCFTSTGADPPLMLLHLLCPMLPHWPDDLVWSDNQVVFPYL